MSIYLKALKAGREATHVPGFHWAEPAHWLEVEGDLEPCRNGLHVCTVGQILRWLAEELWLVEVDDAAGLVDAGDKMAARRARLVGRVDGWDERSARLFAADCAERVLPLFERERPGDKRPRKAIEAARAFARGEIDAAAGAAARAAAGTAARATARDAAGAARAAAWAAAGAAAWAAAGAAAEAAAWAAAGAAARDAGGATARDAAGAAAWHAEQKWQADHLATMLQLPPEVQR
jgi:hypothetical protein